MWCNYLAKENITWLQSKDKYLQDIYKPKRNFYFGRCQLHLPWPKTISHITVQRPTILRKSIFLVITFSQNHQLFSLASSHFFALSRLYEIEKSLSYWPLFSPCSNKPLPLFPSYYSRVPRIVLEPAHCQSQVDSFFSHAGFLFLLYIFYSELTVS